MVSPCSLEGTVVAAFEFYYYQRRDADPRTGLRLLSEYWETLRAVRFLPYFPAVQVLEHKEPELFGPWHASGVLMRREQMGLRLCRNVPQGIGKELLYWND